MTVTYLRFLELYVCHGVSFQLASEDFPEKNRRKRNTPVATKLHPHTNGLPDIPKCGGERENKRKKERSGQHRHNCNNNCEKGKGSLDQVSLTLYHI